MHRQTYRNQLSFIATAVVLTCISAATQAQDYQVFDLGAISPTKDSTGFAVNDLGQVVGQSAADELAAQLHAFRWTGGVMMDLGPLPGNLHSIATGINSVGQITGISYDLGGLFPQAFFWDGGILSPIGPFSPNAINDAGFVVGTQDTLRSDGIWQSEAVIWNGSTINGLGTLGGDNSHAHGINTAGDVVGVSQLADGTTTRAFLSASGLISDLGTLGGVRSHAYSINDQRNVVGVADNAAGSPHAFLFKLNGQGQVVERADLGELGGGYSYALDINQHSEVVGTSDARAFIWKDDSMSDLNNLIPSDSEWRLDVARSISDLGLITGYGKHLGVTRAFLLTPVLKVNALQFELVRGTVVSGDVGDLAESDDQYLVMNSTFNLFRYQLSFTVEATLPTETPRTLALIYESKTVILAGAVQQTIELFNYSTGQYEQVDSRFTSGSDTVVTVTPDGDPNRFVEAETGSTRARISYENSFFANRIFSINNLFRPYRTSADQISWSITR